MRSFRRPALLLLATLAFAAGCEGNETLVPEDLTGSLSFGYTGSERSGVFSANGELRLASDNSIQSGNWGAAFRSSDTLTIVAFQTAGSSRGTLFLATLTGASQPNTFTLACAAGQACSSGVMFNTTPSGSVTASDTTFVLTGGTVVVDTLTSTRVAGSFTASAEYSASATGPRDATRTLSLTSGRFSLPIRDDLGSTP